MTSMWERNVHTCAVGVETVFEGSVTVIKVTLVRITSCSATAIKALVGFFLKIYLGVLSLNVEILQDKISV